MKTLNKAIYTGILISVIGGSYVCASAENINHKNQSNILTHDNYKQLNINDMFTVEQKIDHENSEFFKAIIKYPHFKIKDNYLNKGDIVKKHLNIINNQISNTVIDFKDEIKKASEDYKQTYEKDPNKNEYVKYQYEAVSDYKIEYNKNNILSVPVIMYEFTGGAHGLTNIKSFNYDLLTGKQIQLKDLFKANSNYKDAINKHISEEVEKNPSYYFAGEDGFKGIREDQSFYITNEGIVIYFSLYDIAPYSSGIPMFTITWDDIINYLENPNISK